MTDKLGITFGGVRVVKSPLALEYHREVYVIRSGHANRKRKRWRVSIAEWTTPGAYSLADGTLVVHPNIYAAMKEQKQ